MSIDFLTKPTPVETTAPPKRWRNWYRATPGFEFIDAPNPAPSDGLFPSHEIAEQRAADGIARREQKGVWPKGSVEWAGAYAEGETP